MEELFPNIESKRNLLKKCDLIFPELSYQIMHAAYEVHNQLGPGFTEDLYETALVREFEMRRIAYEKQKVIKVRYKGTEIGTYRLDLVVDQKIILELKAVSSIADIHKCQAYSYLRATGLELAIVINFNNPKVESVRVINQRTQLPIHAKMNMQNTS